MDPDPQGVTPRTLLAVAGAALVGSIAFRAIAQALDLSPVLSVIIIWVVLTVAFLAFLKLRARGEASSSDETD